VQIARVVDITVRGDRIPVALVALLGLDVRQGRRIPVADIATRGCHVHGTVQMRASVPGEAAVRTNGLSVAKAAFLGLGMGCVRGIAVAQIALHLLWRSIAQRV
jgi:hypothetical protein